MLLAIDRVGSAVLLAINLPMLGWRQLSAIGRAIVLHFFVDSGFAAFQVRGLSWCQLTALDPLGDAILLVFLPLAHAALCLSR